MSQEQSQQIIDEMNAADVRLKDAEVLLKEDERRLRQAYTLESLVVRTGVPLAAAVAAVKSGDWADLLG